VNELEEDRTKKVFACLGRRVAEIEVVVDVMYVARPEIYLQASDQVGAEKRPRYPSTQARMLKLPLTIGHFSHSQL
jgi:hypothetical protein